MRISTKIVSAAAAVALVAGSGIAMAGSASAATASVTVSGKTIISLKKETAAKFAAAGVHMTAVKPAQVTASQIGFPVNGMNGREITHTGALKLTGPKGSLTLTSVITAYNQNGSAGVLYASIGGVETAVATMSHCNYTTYKKTDDTHAKPIVRTYKVWNCSSNMTDRTSTISVINSVLGTSMFKPGLGLGRMRTTAITSVEG